MKYILTIILTLASLICSGQNIEDGTYEADVSYYNPNTGYRADYTLEVEIEDDQITVIYFPRGGWLDETHIYSAEIEDFEEYIYMEDDQGREWEVYVYDN